MKLYTYPFAPNVLRVQILMREKRVSAEFVDASADRAAYGAINPLRQVPALLRDDDSLLTESLTIAHYVDALSGPPFLFGDSAEERVQIEMWERRAEMGLFNPAIEYGHHVHPMFTPWMAQFPDYAQTLIPKVELTASVFERQVERWEYVAGDRFTAADITAMLGWFYLVAYGALQAEAWPSLRRWANRMLERDGFEPVRATIAAFNVVL